MSEIMQFQSRVGDDGVLNVRVDLGQGEAETDVVVTIASVADPGESSQPVELAWSEFVEQTYGSCAGLAFERHDQGDFESREPIA